MGPGEANNNQLSSPQESIKMRKFGQRKTEAPNKLQKTERGKKREKKEKGDL